MIIAKLLLQHYMCSREVNLTEEEKEILKSEGLPIPTTLPLTKVKMKGSEVQIHNVFMKSMYHSYPRHTYVTAKPLIHRFWIHSTIAALLQAISC